MDGFGDRAEAVLRQTIPKTTEIRISAVDEYFNRLETFPRGKDISWP
jgi:hypothetical protein